MKSQELSLMIFQPKSLLLKQQPTIKDDENMSLKNKCLFGGWILMASKVYRKKNLPYKCEDWLYCLCKIKKKKNRQSYHYRKLMRAASKLINCKINAMYFIINHEIFLNYFNDSEIYTPWKHAFPCMCEDLYIRFINSYLGKTAAA